MEQTKLHVCLFANLFSPGVSSFARLVIWLVEHGNIRILSVITPTIINFISIGSISFEFHRDSRSFETVGETNLSLYLINPEPP